jgi:hypothetical protein
MLEENTEHDKRKKGGLVPGGGGYHLRQSEVICSICTMDAWLKATLHSGDHINCVAVDDSSYVPASAVLWL